MNRAQRRLAGLRQRPQGLFFSELSKRATNAAYQSLLRSEMEQEANGKPVDPELAARMTKPKLEEQLFQVMVPVKHGNGQTEMLRCSPMMNREACGFIAETIARQIAEGTRSDRRGWGMPEVLPMQRIEGAP